MNNSNTENKNFQNLENDLYAKFSYLKYENFLVKSENKYEYETIGDYDQMIGSLEKIVDQYSCDEGISSIDQIAEDQFSEWLADFAIPQDFCARCDGRGCNRCLMVRF